MRLNSKNKNFLWLSLIVLAVIFILFLPFLNKANANIKLLDSSEFISEFKKASNPIMIDVRTEGEYNSGHVAPAININYEGSDFISRLKDLDTNRLYFVYCRSGNRSARAVQTMKSLGFKNIYELKGGLISNPDILKVDFASTSSSQIVIDIGASSREEINITNVTNGLSDSELEGLLHMREEEKLAHDIYVTLYNKWNLPIFQNISNSENTHTQAVKNLLDLYKVPDPANSSLGVFTNQDIQKLYNDLVAKGSLSTIDALYVGITIEDLDIRDLENYISQTNNSNIKIVYENLMKGSRNHMRSFYSQIISRGGSYSPQYISQQEFKSIISSLREAGPAR